MPCRNRLEAFITAVEEGHYLRAISDFYHAEATMQENNDRPRQGRAALLEHERKILERLASIRARKVSSCLVAGDEVVIHWNFDATGPDGVTRRLDELSLQTWRGDRILHERFFYDTATAWHPVDATTPAKGSGAER